MATIVDERELTALEREHLQACPECSAARAHLASQLEGMARDATRNTPPFRKRIVLPEEHQARPLAWVTQWSMGVAAVTATVLVVVALLLRVWFPDGLGGITSTELAREAEHDRALLAEVRALEQNPLPPAYQEMVPEPDLALDDDFFDYMIPLDGDGGQNRTI
jgi:predicted anti-sigma-YlaC factor YlaD